MNSLPKPTSGAPEKTNYLPKGSIAKKGGMTMLGYRQALGGKFLLETSNQLVFKGYSGFVKIIDYEFSLHWQNSHFSIF